MNVSEMAVSRFMFLDLFAAKVRFFFVCNNCFCVFSVFCQEYFCFVVERMVLIVDIEIVLFQFFLQELSGVAVGALGYGFGCSFDHECASCVASFGSQVNDMVCTFDDVEVVFDDDDGVASEDECLEGCQQFFDVVKVESGGGFVEDEQGGDGLFLAEVIGQFDALVFSAGEGAAGLSQFDVAQPDVLQGFHSLYNLGFAVLGEKFYGLVDGHVEHVIDGLSVELHVEDFLLEAAAVAGFTFQDEVVHKLHFDGDGAFSLAFFTASSFGIEGEEGGCVAHLLGKLLVCHEPAYFVVSPQIGDWIAA